MKKSFNTKLSLKKTDIASLSEKEMKGVQGGYTESAGCPLPTNGASCGCGPADGGTQNTQDNTNNTRGASNGKQFLGGTCGTEFC